MHPVEQIKPVMLIDDGWGRWNFRFAYFFR
ncbi:hypothetical protein OCH239_18675 [Roseivivax halodurans JCM 10272]|uniref:Uncharacterized protein n=1 Tax=Roseivivax halodurans JCM 10272 TaxID=1449350 RepID=X7EA69_9RHOB|nr:hypothetical protein OCH239_18675 [Roseivivax halodurans JCM 10272]